MPVEVDLDIVRPRRHYLTGEIQGAGKGQVSVRIGAKMEYYVVDARMGSFALDGIAKLESEPNVCLCGTKGKPSPLRSAYLWWIRASAAGVFREAGKTVTWEILFRPTQQVVGGDNVVSLMRRR